MISGDDMEALFVAAIVSFICLFFAVLIPWILDLNEDQD